MHSFNFNLRGVPSEVMLLLKSEAKKKNISVNSLILKFVEQGVGVQKKESKKVFHDLDHLGGTWSEKEAALFEASTQYFEQIDKDLWK